MEFVDSTSLSTALPTMAVYFDVRPEELKLALTTYVLALAIFLPVSSWLSDRFGPKRVYLGALGLFGLGSLACAVAPTLPALVAARAVQGVGGALMTPVARSIILRATPREDLVSAMNWFTMPAQLGPLLGPPIAGLVLSCASWRWIFLLNLPIAVLGAVAVTRFVAAEHPSEIREFDFVGYVLAAITITLLVVTAEIAGMLAWNGVFAIAIAGAVTTGTLYYRHALRCLHPVLDIRLLRDLTFRTSMIGGTLSRMAVGAIPLLMPLLLQLGLGWTPLQSGIVMMGLALGTLGAKAISTRIIRFFSFRTVLIGAAIVSAGVNMLPATFDIGTPVWLACAIMVLTGMTRSTQFTLNNTVAYADLRTHELSRASTLASVVQQVGHALGISVGGILLASQTLNGDALSSDNFTFPFVAIGLIGASGVLFYARLSPSVGAHMRGKARLS